MNELCTFKEMQFYSPIGLFLYLISSTFFQGIEKWQIKLHLAQNSQLGIQAISKIIKVEW